MENDPISRPSSLPGADRILIISAPGLRQDSLLAILRTTPGSPEILCVSTLDEGKTLLDLVKPRLVILDHTLDQGQPQKAFEEIRRSDPYVWVIQLVAHPRDVYGFNRLRPDAILCDTLSSAGLLKEVQKALSF